MLGLIFLFRLGRNTEKPPSELQRGKNLILTPCLECPEACSATIQADTHLAKWLREEQGLSQIHKLAHSKPSSITWVHSGSFLFMLLHLGFQFAFQSTGEDTHTDPHTCTLASSVWVTEDPPCPVHPLWALPFERSREDLLWTLSSSWLVYVLSPRKRFQWNGSVHLGHECVCNILWIMISSISRIYFAALDSSCLHPIDQSSGNLVIVNLFSLALGLRHLPSWQLLWLNAH